MEITGNEKPGANNSTARAGDERMIDSKIVNLVTQPEKIPVGENMSNGESNENTIVDLAYLMKRTKSNQALMLEMITLYMEQIPPLIRVMKQSLSDSDWDLLYSAAHKMVPSFAIMGIDPYYESLAKNIQEYAKSRQQTDQLNDLVLQLEKMCDDVCLELTETINILKNNNP